MPGARDLVGSWRSAPRRKLVSRESESDMYIRQRLSPAPPSPLRALASMPCAFRWAKGNLSIFRLLDDPSSRLFRVRCRMLTVFIFASPPPAADLQIFSLTLSELSYRGSDFRKSRDAHVSIVQSPPCLAERQKKVKEKSERSRRRVNR